MGWFISITKPELQKSASCCTSSIYSIIHVKARLKSHSCDESLGCRDDGTTKNEGWCCDGEVATSTKLRCQISRAAGNHRAMGRVKTAQGRALVQQASSS
uniref:Uncharacterized protein n=1 Tax=Amaranthus palmeri TaxID=107608 RepID=A0A6C0T7N7_AMAPA|nr:hypothetical protein AP_R.00g000010-v1.0.a3 [Amaranthus palmeri]